jgi:ArsR family transcriptional regulator
VEESNLSNSTTIRTRVAKPAPPSASPIRVSDETIVRLTDVFNMLADPSRLKIVLALAEFGEMHVSALCEMLGQADGRAKYSQPGVSHHLTLMRMVGLVGFRRDGKHNYYHLVSSHIRDLFEQFFAESGNGAKALQFEDFALIFKRK